MPSTEIVPGQLGSNDSGPRRSSLPSLPACTFRALGTPHRTSAAPRILLEAQFPIESLRAGLPAEELLQRLHLILASSLLEHAVPVPTAFLGVHRVLGEDAVEHVHGVDLGGEVAVVAGVIATCNGAG